VCGFKLYVLGVGYLASVLLWQLFVRKAKLDIILINLWKSNITESVSYWREIFPYQWKIALSWVSGYFIFQLFNPVLFATEGAVIAGQMGMTLQALNAIQAFSMSWLNTKVPLYSKLIALKDYVQLDKIFNRTLHQMVSVCVMLLATFFVVIWILNVTQFSFGGNVLADRFLDYFPMLLLMIPVVIRQYVNSWATYLRCHKQEPFLWYSLFGGLMSCFCVLFFGKMYGLYGITISTCLQCVILSPWGYSIYKRKKIEWHGE
jgi:O-antigen/teichoic acid export membrane protein